MPAFHRVLVVDNDPVYRESLSLFFETRGCAVVTVESGIEALDHMRHAVVDLLVTDLVMPNMDGATLCRVVRADTRLRSTKILLISAVARESFDDPAEYGADVCVAKGPAGRLHHHLEEAVAALADGRSGVFGTEEVHARRVSRELLWDNRSLKAVLSGLTEGILLVTEHNRIASANGAAAELYGRSPEELIGEDLAMLSPAVAGVGDGYYTLVELGGRSLQVQRYRVRGEDRSISVVVLRDISEEIRSRRALEQAVHDRGLLLKEVHHRVKNNLLSVQSYVRLQESEDLEPRTRALLDSIRAHVAAIAAVHDRLYRAGRLNSVPVAGYLEDLILDLVSVLALERQVQPTLELEEIEMPMELTLPLGLIVAELVTNSIRHAHSPTRLELRARLERLAGAGALFAYTDSGPGLPVEILAGERAGTGLVVIEELTRQLGGTLSMDKGPGARFEIRFPIPV